MELRVNDYVRTENGEIGTIIDCPEQLKKDYGKWLWFETTEEQRPIRREQIDKSSPNIMDLIEEGDYVNGVKIEEIYCCGEYEGLGYYDEDDRGKLYDLLNETDIKSIVTKEMYSSVEYRVETN